MSKKPKREEVEPQPEETPADILAQIIWRLTEEAHQHRWDILGVYIPPATRPIHPRLLGTETITLVLLRCQECNWLQTIELDGHWTEEQITVKMNEPIND